MALRQRVRLELEDGTEIEVAYDGRDVRAWEGQFKKSALRSDMSVSMLTWMGWHAAKRQGSTDLNWADFDAACVGVGGVPEAEDGSEPDPTSRPRSRTKKVPGEG